jgi:hypothetical protein
MIPKRIIGMLFVFCAVGCGALPDIVSTEKKDGERYSADEIRQITVDQPFQISGDYFRERDQEPAVVMGGKESKPPAADSKQTASQTVKTPAEASAQKTPHAAAQPSPISKDSPQLKTAPVKAGLIFDDKKISGETARRVLTALPRAADMLPVIIADPDKIHEVMANTPCPQKDLYCLSGALNLYPGVRMAALIEEIQAEGPSVSAKVAVVDAGILFRYPIMQISVPVKGDTDQAIAELLYNVLAFAVNKSQVMPWFCRTFSAENDKWYITAGRQSGLEPGQKLKIISPGTLVKSPNGLPAGWIPGDEKGVLRVDKLFGQDFAVCSLESGAGPAPQDVLIRP